MSRLYQVRLSANSSRYSPAATPSGIAMRAVTAMTQADPRMAARAPAFSGRSREVYWVNRFESSREAPSTNELTRRTARHSTEKASANHSATRNTTEAVLRSPWRAALSAGAACPDLLGVPRLVPRL